MITVAGIEQKDARSALCAIRLKCLDCCVGSIKEVDLCTADDCPLYLRRKGHNPKKIMSEEEKKKSIERINKYGFKKKGSEYPLKHLD